MKNIPSPEIRPLLKFTSHIMGIFNSLFLQTNLFSFALVTLFFLPYHRLLELLLSWREGTHDGTETWTTVLSSATVVESFRQWEAQQVQ